MAIGDHKTHPAGDDFRDGLRRAKQDAGAAAEDVRDDLQDAARAAGRHVRDFLDEKSDDLAHTADILMVRIKRKPVQSLLIALGAGLVIGALLRR